MAVLDKNANARLGQIMREYKEFLAAMSFEPGEYQRTAIERRYRIKAYRYLGKRRRNGAPFTADDMIGAVRACFEGAKR